LAELIPNKWRGYNNALLFLAAVPFSTFGPVIARNVATYTSQSWRWAYYINLILAGLTILLAFFFYHPPIFEQLHTRASKRKVLKELDYLGIVLFTAGLVLFLLGLSWGGQLYPWASGHTLGTLLVGIVLLVGFFVWGRISPLRFVFKR
jgi:MFS family permease